MHPSDYIASLLIVFLVCFTIFLIARELMCWYWKINTMVSLLESIDAKLNSNSSNTK